MNMNRISAFFALNRRLAWGLFTAISVVMALLVGLLDVTVQEQQRLQLLETEVQRSGIELMSQTLNGNLMGSITLLGLIDSDIKQEVNNGLLSVDAHIPVTLSTLGNSFEAEGVFVVGQDGIVKSSWDRINKPSTGLDVKFRPYFQTAIRGQTSVYAAVSMARGDRSRYFAAPVFSERARANSGIGAVVARTSLARVDSLIRDKFDVALLLSPQGVVFASNKAGWIGFVEGAPDAQRLKAIRALKQFGAMFDEIEPKLLPYHSQLGVQRVESRRYALACAKVNWNDPAGDWKLVAMEDLGRSVSLVPSGSKAAIAAVATLLLGWLLMHLLNSRYAQAQANLQLQAYARQQDANVAYRARLADVSMQLQKCTSMGELTLVFLRAARELLGVLQGVLYVSDWQNTKLLHLAGSAACSDPPPVRLTLGEGLLGQCALERRTKVIATPAHGYWTLRSGLGNTAAAALLLTPLMMQEVLIGVLELSMLRPPDEIEISKCEDLIALLVNALDILRRNLQMQQLAVPGTEDTDGAGA